MKTCRYYLPVDIDSLFLHPDPIWRQLDPDLDRAERRLKAWVLAHITEVHWPDLDKHRFLDKRRERELEIRNVTVEAYRQGVQILGEVWGREVKTESKTFEIVHEGHTYTRTETVVQVVSEWKRSGHDKVGGTVHIDPNDFEFFEDGDA